MIGVLSTSIVGTLSGESMYLEAFVPSVPWPLTIVTKGPRSAASGGIVNMEEQVYAAP